MSEWLHNTKQRNIFPFQWTGNLRVVKGRRQIKKMFFNVQWTLRMGGGVRHLTEAIVKSWCDSENSNVRLVPFFKKNSSLKTILNL